MSKRVCLGLSYNLCPEWSICYSKLHLCVFKKRLNVLGVIVEEVVNTKFGERDYMGVGSLVVYACSDLEPILITHQHLIKIHNRLLLIESRFE